MEYEDLLKEIERLRRRVAELEDFQVRFAKSQEDLRRSENKFRKAFDHAALGMALVGLDGRFGHVNQALCRMFGYPEDELSELTFQRITHPEDLGDGVDLFHDMIGGRKGHGWLEKRYIHKNGKEVWAILSACVVHDDDGRPLFLVAQIQDISAQKKAEEALRKSEAKYRFLTEHGSDLIWTVDLNLRTTFVSPSVKKVLGFTPEERMMQNVEDQLTPESLEYVRQRLIEELNVEREQRIQEGKSALVDLDYYHKNGSIVCLQTAVSFVRDEQGIPVGIHGISRDITDL
ncbi:MAG: PAS domain S-box protein, partial [Desulfomonilaceae bacterium]|nr:PAS domain S-box protein [Desulfomonilaceae bacterium]